MIRKITKETSLEKAGSRFAVTGLASPEVVQNQNLGAPILPYCFDHLRILRRMCEG